MTSRVGLIQSSSATAGPKGRVLVTGGAGYIGSHSVLALLQNGWLVTVVDNLSNSSLEVIERIQALAHQDVDFVQLDVRDDRALLQLLAAADYNAVMHFAALKSVNESIENPIDYYSHNVAGTISLCTAMRAVNLKRLIFSSSASVYGAQDSLPISETAATRPSTPYGRSKLMGEELLRDVAASDGEWTISVLRYFNPVGAHASGTIGECPAERPTNLVPLMGDVAAGKVPVLHLYGTDLPTSDGTGVRDFIHVEDLALGHVSALAWTLEHTGFETWNLGTGQGASVLEVLREFESVTGRKIPTFSAPPRAGDVAACWADPEKAKRDLQWTATRNLREMVADHWRWQSLNPDGYKSPERSNAAEGGDIK